MGRKAQQRKVKKQLQRAAQQAPQNLYRHRQVPQQAQLVPKVAQVALGVRVELAGQQMRARVTKASASKQATPTSEAKATTPT